MVNPLTSAHCLNKLRGQPVQLGLFVAQTPSLLLSFTQPGAPTQRSEPGVSRFDSMPFTMCGSLYLLADTGISRNINTPRTVQPTLTLLSAEVCVYNTVFSPQTLNNPFM